MMDFMRKRCFLALFKDFLTMLINEGHIPLTMSEPYQQIYSGDKVRLAKLWELEGYPLRRFGMKAGMSTWDARRFLIKNIDYPLWKERNAAYVANQKTSRRTMSQLSESYLTVAKVLVAGHICSLAMKEGNAAISALEYIFEYPPRRPIDTWYDGLFKLYEKIEEMKSRKEEPRIVHLLNGSISERETYRIGHKLGIKIRPHRCKQKRSKEANPA
jgi:hypothetical protein